MWFKKIKTINRIYGEAKPPQNFSDDFGRLLSNGAHVTWSCFYLWARKIQSEGIWGWGWGWWWFGFFPVLLEYHKSWEKSLSLKQFFRKQICFNSQVNQNCCLGWVLLLERKKMSKGTLWSLFCSIQAPLEVSQGQRMPNYSFYFFLYHKLAELPFFTCGRTNNS